MITWKISNIEIMIFYMQLIGLEDTHSSRHKGLKGHEMIYVMAKIMKPKRRLPKFKKKKKSFGSY